jgi:hypothetical protein
MLCLRDSMPPFHDRRMSSPGGVVTESTLVRPNKGAVSASRARDARATNPGSVTGAAAGSYR